MLYPKSIRNKLGLDEVINSCAELCETEKGRGHLFAIKTSSDKDQIKLWLEQVEELKEILSLGELQVNLNIEVDLDYKNAQVKGYYYNEERLSHILDLLRVLQKSVAFASARKEDYPHLFSLLGENNTDFELVQKIDSLLDLDGNIKSSSSQKLKKISSAIKTKEKGILKSSKSLFTNAKDKGLLAETEIGIKNGRVVLPVLSEHKRKVNGLLIDQSNTGKISYIEPLELVSLNNELAELMIQRRQEVIQILKKITAEIQINLYDIRQGIYQLGVLDFIRAKARLALSWECDKPMIGNDLHVIQAAHPLLKMRLKTEEKELVKLDYDLHQGQRIIVISGPNAGGKSVALKTVGLLQLMFQSGFLVPCDANSTFKIFENIFIDIGDDQSIESDLSTYSSHLKAAKHIINFCDANSLVLMDEIGTGTDPMFGGPMAEAILEEIHNRKAYGVITTHFSNIKAKTEQLKEAVNAAMLFDVKELNPLYVLKLGKPGSSFSFEVATQIGLNKKVIKKARSLTNTQQFDFEKLLNDLEIEKEVLAKEKLDLDRQQKHVAKLEEEYSALRSEIDAKKKVIINQAKLTAKTTIDQANKLVEKTIRDIQESKADKVKTKKARKQLERQTPKVSHEENPQVSKSDLQVGDNVRIVATDSVGEIIEIRKNKATVSMGALKTKINLAKLEKVGVKTEKKVKKYISDTSYNQRQTTFKSDLDIRGMRTYDALQELDSWLDSALILGFSNLRLVHGKGNGILSREVRRHLKNNSMIESIKFEHVDLGGEGVSLIELK